MTASDFDGAFRLLHEQYTWRSYMTPAPSRRRLSLHNVLPSPKVFVAKTGDGAVAATVTRLSQASRRRRCYVLLADQLADLRARYGGAADAGEEPDRATSSGVDP